jgi:predicted site-specific integrase-resolvase
LSCTASALSPESASLCKTIARWAKHGQLPFQRTLGGHRRYPEPAIRELAASLVQEVRAS